MAEETQIPTKLSINYDYLRAVYVAGLGWKEGRKPSLKALSERFGAPLAGLERKSSEEDWPRLRKEYWKGIYEEILEATAGEQVNAAVKGIKQWIEDLEEVRQGVSEALKKKTKTIYQRTGKEEGITQTVPLTPGDYKSLMGTLESYMKNFMLALNLGERMRDHVKIETVVHKLSQIFTECFEEVNEIADSGERKKTLQHAIRHHKIGPGGPGVGIVHTQVEEEPGALDLI